MAAPSFSERLKARRRAIGLSQVGLAQIAGVSLPTIQNIEAGRSNPTLQVLEPLLHALKFEIKIESLAADWDRLAVFGVPLSVGREVVVRGLNEKTLFECLELAVLEVHSYVCRSICETD